MNKQFYLIWCIINIGVGVIYYVSGGWCMPNLILAFIFGMIGLFRD